jgi:putative transposase
MQRVYRLCKALDDLQSRWSQPEVRHRQRYRLQRAARRLRARIRNLVDDLHHRLAAWLCQHFRAIILPKVRQRHALGAVSDFSF